MVLDADRWWIEQGFSAISTQNADGSYTVKLPSGNFAQVFRDAGTGESADLDMYTISELLTVGGTPIGLAPDIMLTSYAIGLDPPAGITYGTSVTPKQLSVTAAQYTDNDFVRTTLGYIRISEGTSSGVGPLSPIQMGIQLSGGSKDFPEIVMSNDVRRGRMF